MKQMRGGESEEAVGERGGTKSKLDMVRDQADLVLLLQYKWSPM